MRAATGRPAGGRVSARVIALAAPSLGPGGVGSYLNGIAAGFAARGWRTHLILTNDGAGLSSRPLPPLAGVHDLSGLRRSAGKVFAAAALVDRIAPAVLLLNHASLMHYALPLLAREVRPVAVVHSDDPRYHRTAAGFAARIFRWVAPTPGVALALAPHLPADAASRVRLVAHGIPETCFGAADAMRDPAPHVAFVGYVAPNKGADLLPAIMARVWERVPRARLTVVGAGPLLERLQREFGRGAGAARCDFTGEIAREQTATVLRAADVLLLPTRVEGFGLAIAEAMAAGAVPVVTRLAGITDFVVEDGRTGLLAPSEDVAGFAAAVAALLTDEPRRAVMARDAVAAARARFSAAAMLDALVPLFAEDDDRPALPRRGRAGWVRETAGELIGRGVGPDWLARRCGDLFQ